MDKLYQSTFQQSVIKHLTGHGWQEGKAEHYDPVLALYPADLIAFVREHYPEQLQKLTQSSLAQGEQILLRRVAEEMDQHGALAVLRHGLKNEGVPIGLCQFLPHSNPGPETPAPHKKNRLRLVPKLAYSPYARKDYDPCLDLALFVNGVPTATLKLASDPSQSVYEIIRHYQQDHPAKDPKTGREEPLPAFQKRALAHFAVSHEEVWMATCLEGESTCFLPFNRGAEGGSGNPLKPEGYATDYLWKKVLEQDAWLNLLGHFIYTKKENKEHGKGEQRPKKILIFPRFHQWEAVNQLAAAARVEGPGHRYLIEHSAGSGKSHSIAWTAHHLALLSDERGRKIFNAVIIISGCKELDAQFQGTLYQFGHAGDALHRLTQETDQNLLFEQLTAASAVDTALIMASPQAFPWVLELIQNNPCFKGHTFAVIADEAGFPSLLAVNPRSAHISYFIFAATPAKKTLELFGRPANPELPPCDNNRPKPFHLYTMQQAVEEGFILDVLKRYTTYAIAFEVAQQQPSVDKAEDQDTAYRIFPWIQCPPDKISIEQKAGIIMAHFRDLVAHLLNGQAKAVLITSSRQAALRYKMALEHYTAIKQYQDIEILSSNEQVIIGPSKLQADFHQSTLCAMYVDKKLTGTDCVQTLSQLNRTRPGKETPFILDFVNSTEQVRNAFLPYYPIAELAPVSTPEEIYQLQSQLDKERIYTWQDVEAFAAAFFDPQQTSDRLHYHCRAAADRFRNRYQEVMKIIQAAQQAAREAIASGDRIRNENARHNFQQARETQSALVQFKKNLAGFVHRYGFISQIVDFGDQELEKLNIYARYLYPLLEGRWGKAVDLPPLDFTPYRLTKIQEQELKTGQQAIQSGLGNTAGGNSDANLQLETQALSSLIAHLNRLLKGATLSDRDRLNYLYTIKDKLLESPAIAAQLENQAPFPLNDFSQAVQQAVIASLKNHHEIAARLLHDELIAQEFSRFLLELILIRQAQ